MTKLFDFRSVNKTQKIFWSSLLGLIFLSTSGHADRETIKKVIDIVNPMDKVIVIHKEVDASLAMLY